MRVRPKTSVLTRRPARRRHDGPRTAAPAPQGEPPRAQEQRVRESGGPIDRASYSCACGLVFEADVSTTVSCPHCGDQQAW